MYFINKTGNPMFFRVSSYFNQRRLHVAVVTAVSPFSSQLPEGTCRLADAH